MGWKAWELAEVASLKAADRAGLASLELIGHEKLLATWRFSTSKLTQARHLEQVFSDLRRNQTGAASKTLVASICPSCGVMMQPGQTVCLECARLCCAPIPPVRSGDLRVSPARDWE